MTPRASQKALDAIESPRAHPDVWEMVRRGIESGDTVMYDAAGEPFRLSTTAKQFAD